MPPPAKHPFSLLVVAALLFCACAAVPSHRIEPSATPVAVRQAPPPEEGPEGPGVRETPEICESGAVVPGCIPPPGDEQPAQSPVPPSQIFRGQRTTCFPGNALVTLANDTRVPMREVRVGEVLHVYGGGKSTVMMFTHRDASAVTRFVTVETEAGKLTASAGHFVFVGSGVRRMSEVEVGDRMSGMGVVTATGEVWGVGLYNPQTEGGELVVEGFRVTAYTDALGDGGAFVGHALLAPVRWGVAVLRGMDLVMS